MPPKLYTQHQYEAMRELLVRANARMIQLYDKWQAAENELRTMKARKKATVRMFKEFAAPEAPDTLSEVVKAQQARGQRP